MEVEEYEPTPPFVRAGGAPPPGAPAGGEERDLVLTAADVDFLRQFRARPEGDNTRASLPHIDLVADVDSPGRLCLRPDGCVGVVRLPSGTEIRIRPKIGSMALLQMVEVVLDAKVHGLDEEIARPAGDSFVDLIGFLYLGALERLYRQGLARDYVATEDDLSTVRGALVFQRLFDRGLPPVRLPCAFDDLTFDNPLNRTVLAAARALGSLVRSADLKVRLLRWIREMETEVAPVPPSRTDLDRLRLGRHQAHYARILPLARAILRHLFHDDVKGGTSPGMAFLLQTPPLFQDFLTRLFHEWAGLRRGEGMSVQAEEERRGLLDREQGTTRKFTLRPDLRIDRRNEPWLVVDAKYKKKTTQGDAYQIVAYGMALRCHGLLISPKVGEGFADELYRGAVPGPSLGKRFGWVHLDVSPVARDAGSLLGPWCQRLDDALARARLPEQEAEPIREAMVPEAVPA